jgi:DNA-binding CsgD family transcriptional regulator
MSDGIEALSEREKQTLRLILDGHDAKSMARSLGLSVHTINERLRDARRKLGVSSSREAARLLGQAERTAPDFLADKNFGLAHRETDDAGERQDRPANAGRSFAWLGGAALVMSLIIVAIMAAAAPEARRLEPVLEASAGTPAAAARSLGAESALAWLSLVDKQDWSGSWRAAGVLFRSQVPESRWPTVIRPVREPLGRVISRSFRGVTKASSLPGAPDGEYELIEFQTRFQAREAIETVVMAHERPGWRVDGYFIR